jgi:ATPase family associated with various cellular activities (AAA)
VTNPLTYLEILGKAEPLSFKSLRAPQIANLALGKLYTVNSVYRRDLVKAQYDLYEYFNRSLHRPFNCLLLGPPGSGKSFIAKQLADFENRADFTQLADFGIDTKAGGLQPGELTDRVTRAKFLEYNLSQFHRPDEITQIFRDIAGMAAEPKIVLLDEFDVKIGSSSVIRYLIEPMYDGKVAGTELGKTAFIFSGSYLSNKELLGRLQREKSQIDLPKFMFDYYYKVAIKNGKGAQLGNEVYNLFHTCDVYRRYQEEMTPERDITIYLRQLDKFWDFLSRINGFVMEVPDISAPLDTTDPPAALLTGKFSCCPHDERSPICSRSGGVAEKLIEWLEIEATIRGIQTRQRGDLRTLSQRFTYYDTEFEPILQYKDMLLKERLHALLTMFDNERKTRREKKEPKGNTKWTSETVVVMKRSLLNYLSTAPLVHGMRSLSTLMWNLKAEEGRPRKDGQPGVDWSKEWDDQGREQYTITLGDYEKVARHVRQEGDYQDPQTLWRFL